MSVKYEIDASSKDALYESLISALKAVFAAEKDWLANLANASSLIFHTLPDLNWAGFYLFKENELVLGPFQGKLACTRIKLGRGVCGNAAQQRITLRVADVDTFPGHIACDSASRSEIVIPIILRGGLYGVLDLDSPIKDRFDATDQTYLEQCVRVIVDGLESKSP